MSAFDYYSKHPEEAAKASARFNKMANKKKIGQWVLDTDDDVTVTLPKIDEDKPQAFVIKTTDGNGIITIQTHPDDQPYSLNSVRKDMSELTSLVHKIIIGLALYFVVFTFVVVSFARWALQ